MEQPAPLAKRKYPSLTLSKRQKKLHDFRVPAWVVDLVRTMGDGTIDLDPCCDVGVTSSATTAWFPEENGLTRYWYAKTVWLHPPHVEMRSWVTKAVNEFKLGNCEQIILLTRVDPSTQWWTEIKDFPWLAFHSRLYYEGASHPTPFANAMFYLGTHVDKFTVIVGSHGTVYSTVKKHSYYQQTDVLMCAGCKSLLKIKDEPPVEQEIKAVISEKKVDGSDASNVSNIVLSEDVWNVEESFLDEISCPTHEFYNEQ